MCESAEKYRCRSCGWTPADDAADAVYDHCPNCLESVHDEPDEDDEECGGYYEPVSIWVKPDGSWNLIQRCSFCGEMRAVPVNPKDNPVKMMSIAAKPLANPPFPIERMAEMTKMMGGRGDMGGYDSEA